MWSLSSPWPMNSGVSDLTVRRDLKRMADEGLLVRTRGGASMRDSAARELSYLEKTAEAHDEKVAIAAAAAGLIEAGDSIIIGPGTSTLELANQIKLVPDLTVVTDSLLVIDALMNVSNIQVEATAGSLRRSIRALVGPLTEESLRSLRVNKVFMSGNGLSGQRGLTTPEVTVAASDRALAAAGERRMFSPTTPRSARTPCGRRLAPPRSTPLSRTTRRPTQNSTHYAVKAWR